MIKKCSVRWLNKVSRNKEIWCFGCGKRLNDMLELYLNEPFMKRVTRLLDNNQLLDGKTRKFGKREIEISRPDIIGYKGNKQVFILVTSDRYEEIYEQIAGIVTEKGIGCARYPFCYYNYSIILLKICCCIPVRRQLLFRAGEQPYENAKAILEYLIENDRKAGYKKVIMGDDKDMCLAKIKKRTLIIIDSNTLKQSSSFKKNLQYCFYLATSKFLFYENEPIHKVRDEQILIYLNHGTIPLKNVKDVLGQPKEVDYALCPSKGCAEIYEQQYHIPKEKQLYIIPPRDVYLLKKKHKLNQIVACSGRQVIIWLPTFRKLKGTERRDSFLDSSLPLIKSRKDYYLLNEQLKANRQLLLIKSHPGEKNILEIPEFCDCIEIIYEEKLKAENIILQEILGGTNALITDYSGIAFEYLLLDRPIGYVISDLEDYIRGFAFENVLDYMPGCQMRTRDELLNFINGIKAGKDEFKEKRNVLKMNIFQGNELKNGAQELLNFLEKQKNGGKRNGF